MHEKNEDVARVAPSVPCVAPAGSTAERRPGTVTAAERPDQLAERIARDAHAGQKDTVTGADYITHVERVVNIVRAGMIGSHLREEAVAVAWLHDVVEDSAVTILDLCRAGFSDDVLDAVQRLTRNSADTYSEYIHEIRVLGPPLARIVKIADLQDHLQPNCPARLRPRYERALQALTEPAS